MGLAERIKEAMGERENAEFARDAGVTPASVTFWLSGQTKSLKAETAARIEKATGYRANWIVTGKGPRRVSDQPTQAESWPFQSISMAQLAELAPEQREHLEVLLRAELAFMASPAKPQEFSLRRSGAGKAKRYK